MTYRPGTKNVKADALSRLHAPDQPNHLPESILTPAAIVSPIQWALDDQIAEATHTEPAVPLPPLFPWSEEPYEVPAVNHWFQESERV